MGDPRAVAARVERHPAVQEDDDRPGPAGGAVGLEDRRAAALRCRRRCGARRRARSPSRTSGRVLGIGRERRARLAALAARARRARGSSGSAGRRHGGRRRGGTERRGGKHRRAIRSAVAEHGRGEHPDHDHHGHEDRDDQRSHPAPVRPRHGRPVPAPRAAPARTRSQDPLEPDPSVSSCTLSIDTKPDSDRRRETRAVPNGPRIPASGPGRPARPPMASQNRKRCLTQAKNACNTATFGRGTRPQTRAGLSATRHSGPRCTSVAKRTGWVGAEGDVPGPGIGVIGSERLRVGPRHLAAGPQKRTTEGSHSAYTARRIGATSVERSVPALKRKAKTPQQMGGTASGGSTRSSGAAGGVQGVNVIILVLVAASVTIAAGLLAETVNTARAIDKKAKSIRDTGIGINTATDSIAQLQHTNRVASSILKTATPLERRADEDRQPREVHQP